MTNLIPPTSSDVYRRDYVSPYESPSISSVMSSTHILLTPLDPTSFRRRDTASVKVLGRIDESSQMQEVALSSSQTQEDEPSQTQEDESSQDYTRIYR
jgi:hypothetical protein